MKSAYSTPSSCERLLSIATVLALACLMSSFAYAAAREVIYAIAPDGNLLYFTYQGISDGSNSWGQTNVKIGNGWKFRQVFSGGDGVIFAINERNELLYFKYLGVSNGAQSWGNAGLKISGDGWDYRHVFYGGDGVIFANNNNELRYFKYKRTIFLFWIMKVNNYPLGWLSRLAPFD